MNWSGRRILLAMIVGTILMWAAVEYAVSMLGPPPL